MLGGFYGTMDFDTGIPAAATTLTAPRRRLSKSNLMVPLDV
jgi:hypothetical protein